MLAAGLGGGLLSGGAGCEGDAFDNESRIVACRCETEVCGPRECSFKLTLHPNCADEVSVAEILIDDHLEVATLRAGQTLVACSRTEPGASSEVTVRGGAWIWGPLKRSCPTAGGEEHTLIFECSEAF